MSKSRIAMKNRNTGKYAIVCQVTGNLRDTDDPLLGIDCSDSTPDSITRFVSKFPQYYPVRITIHWQENEY